MNLDAYCMGRFEVTNAEYKAFLDATHHRGVPRYWKGGTYPEGKANHPVLFVSLVDAEAYCEWIKKATGWNVVIPTSEQWEKAARSAGVALSVGQRQGLDLQWRQAQDALQLQRRVRR